MLFYRIVFCLSLALVGAGVHAQDEHSPLLQVSPLSASSPKEAAPAPTFVVPVPRVLPTVVTNQGWYMAPRLGIIIPNQNGRVRNSLLEGVSVGRWLGPSVSVDVNSTINTSRFNRPSNMAGKQWENIGVGVTGRWYEGTPLDTTRWYLLGGVGADHNTPVGNQFHSGWSPEATVGVGMQHAFTDRVALRTELSMRYDKDPTSSSASGISDSTHYSEPVASVGLVIGLDSAPHPYVVYHQDLGLVPSHPPVSSASPLPSCATLDSDGINNCQDRCLDTPLGIQVRPNGCPAKTSK